RNVPILAQNENGPCPLLAIANVLLLRGSIEIHPDRPQVGYEELVALVGDYLLVANSQLSFNEEVQANQAQNLSDCMSQFPTLRRGLDVNVRFSGCQEFEYTQEHIVFDLCRVRILHGWVVDKQDKEVCFFLYNSYFSVVSRIVREGLVAQSFLSKSASQLTYLGLVELHSTLGDNELCAFFRNNHFSTLYKMEGQLYVLVTDLGYLHEQAVWESAAAGPRNFRDARPCCDGGEQFRIFKKSCATGWPRPRALAARAQHSRQRCHTSPQADGVSGSMTSSLNIPRN
ncbi:hypothetical protein T492DRAFT_1120692, partial [Pavlovales sp. CCMP2436]